MSTLQRSVRAIVICLISSSPALAFAGQDGTDRAYYIIAESAGQPEQRRVLTTLSVSMAGLQAFDTYSTLTVLKRGGAESNPLLQGIAGHPAVFIGIKAGVTTASIYAAERLWRDHHRGAAIALMAVTNGIMAAVAVNNASALNASR